MPRHRREGGRSSRKRSGDEASKDLATLSSRLEIAGCHATANIPIARPDDTAGTVRERLIGKTFDTVADVAVCVDGRLVGIVGATVGKDVLAQFPAAKTTLGLGD
jgi:hypothetical protein